MEPIIGITLAHCEEEIVSYPRQYYVEAVQRAGGVPLLLPVAYLHIERYLHLIDGLILTGGSDVDASYFGEEPLQGTGKVFPDRDRFEISIAKRALEMELPLLGICRGMQVMNIAAGGDIYQDIVSQLPGVLEHSQKAARSVAWHTVGLVQGSKLAESFQGKETRVNSFHHQAVRKLAPGFECVAKAKDGIIEGIESKHNRYALGIQWHPEGMLDSASEGLALFRNFIKSAK